MSDRPAVEGNAVRPDEQEPSLPAAWSRRRHPRRGGRPVPEVTVDDSAVEKVAEMVREGKVRDQIEAGLRSPDSESEVVEAARRHLSGDIDPLGAAAIANIAVREHGAGFEGVIEQFVDSWIAGHGLTFAARALTELAALSFVGYYTPRPGLDLKSIRYVLTGDAVYAYWRARSVPRKVRALLAAADDDAYEDAVKYLADHRRMPMHKAMASYLVPTRHDWVEESVSVLPGARVSYSGWLLWCALGSPAQAGPLAARLPLGYAEAHADILATIIDGVGTAIASPLAIALDGKDLDANQRTMFLQTLAALPTDEAFQIAVDRLDRSYVEAAVSAAAKRFPRRALRLLTPASRSTSKAGSVATDLLRAHVPAHPELVAELLPVLPAEDRAALEAIAASTARRPEAPAEALPPVLTAPPWVGRRKGAKPLIIAGLEPPDLRSVSWASGEREKWQAEADGAHRHWRNMDELVRDFAGLRGSDQAHVVLFGDKEEVRPLLHDWVPTELWYLGWRLRPFVARFGLDALPAALGVAKAGPANWGGGLLPFLDPQVARLQASWFARLKSARGQAAAWFDRHGLEAAMMLVPDAVGKAGADRRNAGIALRHIASRHGGEAVVEVAGRYNDEAAKAIATLLATDPLEVLPARIPKVPEWADPLGLPQVLLRDRERGLPDDATRHVLTMLAMSRPGETYAGIDVVRETCDPASLAEFSWAVFRRWQANGSPSKDGWALAQLGLLGDDDAVRGLAPIIRAWPGEGGHARAVQGLDVLAAIGTDVALMHLHGIAEKVKFKGLRTRAQEKIDQVAAELRLTPEQLADRLVPDFGLDADGSMTFDYGPRRFTVGFDEELKPYVLDEDGKRRKALPKPGAKDDEDLAPAAYKRFAQLKKDVRTVAGDQIRRLESAMVQGRRWPLTEFRDLFADHPLIWHIVRRLVLLAEHDGVTTTFRIAEDRTLADSDDEILTLPTDAGIAIPHPLHLGGSLEAWSEIFADYEIVQPFPQLGRPVHTLTDEERATGRLRRFEGVGVPIGKVLGLQRRGWERGRPLDGGVEGWISREIAPGHHVSIALDPGVAVSLIDLFPEQTLVTIGLGREPNHPTPATSAPTFADVPAPVISELLDDLIDLTTP